MSFSIFGVGQDLQIVTGIALASAYVPSAGQAYHTLAFISGTRFGHIVRGIYSFGASAMVILIGIHAIRVYLFGAYKYPRQMGWLTGVALLFLVLGMAFTGQLLRWDQTGFWSVVIAAERAGRTPFIGNWLGHFILAGDTSAIFPRGDLPEKWSHYAKVNADYYKK